MSRGKKKTVLPSQIKLASKFSRFNNVKMRKQGTEVIMSCDPK